MFTEYTPYILALGTILLAMGVFAISNAKECPYPSECFDCSKPSCQACIESCSEEEAEPIGLESMV